MMFRVAINTHTKAKIRKAPTAMNDDTSHANAVAPNLAEQVAIGVKPDMANS